jgi:hypothetical protein
VIALSAVLPLLWFKWRGGFEMRRQGNSFTGSVTGALTARAVKKRPRKSRAFRFVEAADQAACF